MNTWQCPTNAVLRVLIKTDIDGMVISRLEDEGNMHYRISKCVKPIEITFNHDTLLDFGVIINILRISIFCWSFLTFILKTGSVQHVSDKVLRAK